MASGGSSNEGSSWWGSLIKTAKEKSINALEMIKTDLVEFKTTMSNDTTILLNQASSQLKESTNSTSLFNSLSFASFGDQTVTSEIVNSKQQNKARNNSNRNSVKQSNRNLQTSSSIHDRYKQELNILQLDEKTYLTDPTVTNIGNSFPEWLEKFNPDNFKSNISDLLIENSSMRLLYSQLVPAQISNNQFWSRYFFKVNQIEEEYKRRIKLLERATDDTTEKEETYDWEEDENCNPETETVEHINENEDSSHSKDINSKTDVPSDIKNENENENESSNLQDNSAKSIESETVIPKTDSLGDIEKIKDLNIVEIESNQKTEDSDEWEKVSDINLNDNNETSIKKKSSETVENVHVKETSQNDKPEGVAQTSATDKNKTQIITNENEWDDWD